MKFSIITPTYKRPEKLLRAVNSLLSQTYQDWEMIIVNDSPSDTSYKEFSSSINDARIHYHVNDTNKGVNYSRNYAIDKVSADSKWIILLDDDNYFAPDTLQTFHNLILLHGNQKWFVTNRALTNGKPVTKFPKDESRYSYAWEYLLLRRCKGDATHCIETKLINQHHIRFSQHIKQGEEWLFFYQLGLLQKMYYSDHNSTITDTEKNKKYFDNKKINSFEIALTLLYESFPLRLYKHPTFILYSIVNIIKKIFSRK